MKKNSFVKLKFSFLTSLIVVTGCGVSEPSDEAYAALIEIVDAGKNHFREHGNLRSFGHQKIAEQKLISEEHIFGADVMLPTYGGVKIYDRSDNNFIVSISSVTIGNCIYLTETFAEGLQGHGLEAIRANSEMLWSGGEVSEELEERCSVKSDRAEYYRFEFNVTR